MIRPRIAFFFIIASLPGFGVIAFHAVIDFAYPELASDKLQSTVVMFLFAAVCYLVVINAVKKSVLNPIRELLDATKKLEQGELELTTESIAASELIELRDGFIAMAKTRLNHEQELMLVQQERERNEKKLFNHMINTPLGCIFWDKAFRCTGWNKAAEKIFGYTEQEAMGRHATELIVPKDIQGEIEEAFMLFLKQGSGVSKKNHNVTRDGSIIVCEWYNTPIMDTEGTTIGVTSLIQDITMQATFEEKSRTTTDLLAYSQTAAKVGGWELDLETNELFWTAETYRIHEASPETFNPTVDAGVGFFLPASQPVITLALAEAMESGKGYALELETYTAKGRVISVFTNCTVTMKNGKPAKLTGIIQDITEQNLAKNNLNREQLRLKSILATAAEGIILIDNQGTVLSFNIAAEKMFGIAADQVIGQNVSTLMPDPYRAEHDSYLSNYIETREAKIIGKGREVTGKHANGQLFPIGLSVSEWFDGDEQLFTGVVRDLTAQKETQSQLIQTQKMESFSQLSGGLAHDFNNLLAVIMGNLDLLKLKMKDDDENLRPIQSALHAVERGADITDRMLRFSRVKSSFTGFLVSQNVNEMLEEMVDILRQTLGPTFKLGLTCETESVWIRVDPAEFENVILNLGINARDAMDGGGTFTVSASKEYLEDGNDRGLIGGEWLHMIFADTGEGIPRKIQEKIFEPFFTTKTGRGSGLGLAMAYSFAKQNEGHISVNSELGHGTQFHIHLPLSLPPVADSAGDALAVIQGGDESILLVDDERAILELTEQQLTDLGYQVHIASNAEEALVILRDGIDVDLLFTDIMMPGGMLGTELAEVAQRLRPELRVLLTSGFAQPADSTSENNPYASLILKKPYRIQDVSKRIRETLEG